MNYSLKNGWLKTALILVLGGVWNGASNAESPKRDDDVIEKGKVAWMSDLDTAKQESKKTGKPMFLLFQEIPG